MIAALAMLPVTLTSVTSPVSAVPSDGGWTHLENSKYVNGALIDYPEGNPQVAVDCYPERGGRGCVGWSDDTASGASYPNVKYTVPSGWTAFYHTQIDAAVSKFVNATDGTGVGTAHSPWYDRNNTGATITFAQKDLGRSGLCGEFIPKYIQSAPNNHGCCQQLTLAGGTLYFNQPNKYNATGDYSEGNCDIRWTLNHELGHSLGLGHTVYTSQTMYLRASSIYAAQSGDKRGVFCIYETC